MQTNNFDGFEALWQRVQGSDHTEYTALSVHDNRDETEARMLETFMDGEAAAISAYRALYKRWQGSFCAAGFAAMAKDEKDHLARLETAYFLLTGDSYVPKRPDKPDTGMPEALRAAWNTEQASAEAYRRAARQSQLPALARMYDCIAADEERHAEMLFGMIQRLMR